MVLIFSVGIVWLIVTYLQPMVKFRFDLMGRYLEWSKSFLQTKIQNENQRRFLILILPILLVAIIIYDFKAKHYFLLNILINIFILWFAWIYQEKMGVIAGSPKAKEEEIFYEPLSGPFAVVFWFFFTGPIGVLFYDLTRRLQYHSIKSLLEWPVSRALGFGYALAGHFSPVFNYWSRYFFSQLNNVEFVKSCGLYALYAEKESKCDNEDQLQHALNLVRRAKTMLFIIVLIFSIGVLL